MASPTEFIPTSSLGDALVILGAAGIVIPLFARFRPMDEGPLRDRLHTIDGEVQHAVTEIWDIARRGDELDEALSALNTPGLTASAAHATDPETQASLQSQLEAAARLRSTRDDTDDRLRLLTTRMGKDRVIAETGAGQHGVATATAAALLGMECMVYMGEVDMARQELNVFRMKLLGAEVRPASSGSRTLKDAVNEIGRAHV